MELVVVSVLDLKSAAFSHPTFVAAKGVAIRSFMDAVADPQHVFNRHPEDFRLMHIGQWNDLTSEYVPLVPTCLITALEAIARE